MAEQYLANHQLSSRISAWDAVLLAEQQIFRTEAIRNEKAASAATEHLPPVNQAGAADTRRAESGSLIAAGVALGVLYPPRPAARIVAKRLVGVAADRRF